MTQLTKSQLSILAALKAAGGPMPASALAESGAKAASVEDDLKTLAETGFIGRKAKSVRITEIGLAALEPAPHNAPKPKTKKARLIELLNADEGVTVPDLAQTLGWQQHTTRAALTGLKKDGIVVQKLPPHEGSRASRYTLATASVGGSL
jgi:DNA-binding IclR family transcriptional regulator